MTHLIIFPQIDCSTLPFVRDKVPVFCEKRTEVFNGEYVTTRGCSVDYRWEDVQGYRDISGEEMVMMFNIHFVCSRLLIISNNTIPCCQGARCPASGGLARRRACAAATGATRACPGAWAGRPSSPFSPPSCSDHYYNNLGGKCEEQKNNKVETKNTRNCYIKELECLQSQCCTV